ncbi:MAG: hypothetical protein QM778_10600 [Myxococcales bacterium]
METTMGNGAVMDTGRSARQPDARDGILGSFFSLSLGMVESSVRTTANLGRTVTTESQKVGEAMITLNEQSSQALIRTARKLNESAFGLLTDVVNRLEGAALVVISQGQQTSDRVAELAAQASQAAVGSRGLNGSARV